MILSSSQVSKLVMSQIGGKLDTTLIHSKLRYWAGPKQDFFRVIRRSKLDKNTYFNEKFNCADFVWVLKSDFLLAAYKDDKRKLPYCMGIAWGRFVEFDIPHAMNWFIPSDKRLRFIEPQTDKVRFPKPGDRNISLMIA